METHSRPAVDHPIVSYPRYHSLDLIRGIAVLAILVVNIWAFAMPFAAYMNPPVWGDLTGANKLAWLFSFVLVQEKFITIFSILFGAGVALFVEHAQAKARPAASLHYRRMAILLLFGLIHGYGIWSGDILVPYAVLGMIVYWFLPLRTRGLLISTVILIVIGLLLILMFGFSMQKMPAADLAEIQRNWSPDDATIAKELAALRGPYLEQMATRASNTLELQTIMLSFYSFRLLAHMLIGVWLYRIGFLTGRLHDSVYVGIMLAGFGIGLPMAYIGADQMLAHNFAFEYAMGGGQLWNNIGSLLMAFGYMSLFLLWHRRGGLQGVRRALENAGRMAFTLYISSSVICSLIFYGHGLGLLGQMERWQQLVLALTICLLLTVFAAFWLQHYRQGPLEALWRWLTYGRQQHVASGSAQTAQDKPGANP